MQSKEFVRPRWQDCEEGMPGKRRGRKIAPEDYLPDFVAWFRRDAFTEYELALLAAGIDPECALTDDLWDDEQFPRTHRANAELLVAYERYQELYPLIQRSVEGGKLARHRNYPTAYIPRMAGVIFVIETGVFCDGFREQARILAEREISKKQAQNEEKSAPPSTNIEKPLLTRERETALKLILGMAVKGYKYDPAAARNAATKEITDDLLSLGLSIDEDTVRKWLREAAELMPPPGSE